MQTPAKTSSMPTNSAQNDSAPTLETLQYQDAFIDRHIGPEDGQVAEMLETLGLESLEQLIEKTVPASILSERPMSVGDITTLTLPM